MYKVSVPFMNSSATDETRGIYLEQVRRAGAERVFLIDVSYNVGDPVDEEVLQSLRENIAFFKSHGYEVGVWVGATVGHGGTPLVGVGAPKAAEVQTLVNLDGEERHLTRCPLDEVFRKSVCGYLAALAGTGVDLILLDDDFRMSQHGKVFCCACPLHMEKIREYCGEDITREQLKERAFSGPKNKYRDAWLKAQGDGLRLLAREMRDAVDGVDPSVRLAMCSSHAVWDMDGVDALELTRIFSGKNTPILRLQGAPYWAVLNDKTLPAVFEIARMHGSFCDDGITERMAEGDTYPRPRYNVPASYLELFDGVMRAGGEYDGILKYIFDYAAGPEFETGYLDRHCRNIPYLKQIEKAFPEGANQGVRVLIRPHSLNDADLDLTVPSDQSPYPVAGVFLGINGIPTLYNGKGICTAVFGEGARIATETDLEPGAILDAPAAILLARRGIDVGLSGEGRYWSGTVADTYTDQKKNRGSLWKAEGRYRIASLKENAVPVLFARIDGKERPLAYRYENAQGQRFLVWMFDGSSLSRNSSLLHGYNQQKILTEGIEWISGRPLPASCIGHPDLYVMCAKTGKTRSVALFNCFDDSIDDGVISLDTVAKSAEFYGCSGRLEGNRILLDAPLHAWKSALILLHE